jgi:SAM-dependent methyltransferase
VLEHLPEERPALAEISRSLKPGGILLASVPAFMALWSWHDEQAGHQRRYRLRELRALVADAGFEEMDALYFNSLLALPIFLVRKFARALPSMKDRIEAELSPGRLNGLFRTILSTENRLALRGLRLPWGTSAVLVARKLQGDPSQGDSP